MVQPTGPEHADRLVAVAPGNPMDDMRIHVTDVRLEDRLQEEIYRCDEDTRMGRQGCDAFQSGSALTQIRVALPARDRLICVAFPILAAPA